MRAKKEETALYAKRLFDQTAELLSTNKFHIAGGVLRTFVEDFHLVSLADTSTPVYSKDVDCFFNDGNAFHTAKNSLISKGYVEGKQRTNSVVMEKAGHTTYDLVYLPNTTDGMSIILDFDFTNCCIAFGRDGLITTNTFWDDVENRVIRISNSKIPYHSIARAGKFMKQGYDISESTKIQLFDNAALSAHGPYEEDEYGEKTASIPYDLTPSFDLDDIPF